MNVTVEQLPKTQAALTIEVSPEEAQPHIDAAAKKIAKEISIKGFRKGKVPYDVLVQHVGENAIYEEAFNAIVEETYTKAIDQEGLQVVGRANIDVEKLAPGNPIVYKATVPLMPSVKLGNYKKLKTKKDKVEMDETRYEKTIDDLRKMRATEKLVEREAKDGDIAVIDFDVKIDGVSIEGGQGKEYRLNLGAGQFIPGFEENVVGMKKDEEKTFNATFPKDYHKKDIAGKEAEVDVKLHNVYEQELPEIDDEFAQGVNFKDKAELEAEIRKNITKEIEDEAQRKFELEAVKEIVKSSKVDELPEQLVKEEVEKMMYELRNDVMQRGMQFEDYLQHMGKTEEELSKEFEEQAVERIEAAIVLRELAVAEDIKVEASDIEEELNNTREAYKDIPDALEQINHPAYRSRVENMLMNKKTFERIESFTK